jgi:hypothetical protein
MPLQARGAGQVAHRIFVISPLVEPCVAALVFSSIFVISPLVEPCVAALVLSSTCYPSVSVEPCAAAQVLSSTLYLSELVLLTGCTPAGPVAFGRGIVSVSLGPWGRSCLRSPPIVLAASMDSRCLILGCSSGHHFK